ncbi:MAG: acyl-CoA dehydrogenase family protein [Sporichthyaceae bacterium]
MNGPVRTAPAWESGAGDPDVAALNEMIDALLADHDVALDDGDSATDHGRALLVAQGLWSIAMPEEVGGGEGPTPLLLHALARIARGWPALALGCAHAHAAVSILAHHEDWTTVAAAVAAGSPIAVVDAAGPMAELTVGHGPERTQVDGTVSRVDVADVAPSLLLVDAAASRALLVAASELGIVHKTVVARTGLAGARTHPVALVAVLTDSQVLPPLGASTLDSDAAGALALLHLQVAAIACGIAAGALEATTGYVGERHQFGAPLAALPTIARAVFDARSDVTAAFDRALAVATAPGGIDPLAAASALRSAFAAAIPAATAAIQLHGGYGYLQEYPVERAFRDLVSLRAAAALAPVLDAAAVLR